MDRSLLLVLNAGWFVVLAFTSCWTEKGTVDLADLWAPYTACTVAMLVWSELTKKQK